MLRCVADPKQLAELKEARLDLEAHQEALKISRERCESKVPQRPTRCRQKQPSLVSVTVCRITCHPRPLISPTGLCSADQDFHGERSQVSAEHRVL